MHYVYILYSETIQKFYIGYSENPSNRLEFHNSDNNKIWSQRGKPWELKIVFPFENKTQALKAEKFIKKQKSSKYILSIIDQKIIIGFN